MRTATNQSGFNVEKLTPYGWCVAGFNQPPHATRDLAEVALAQFQAAAPATEWRVMPALEASCR